MPDSLRAIAGTTSTLDNPALPQKAGCAGSSPAARCIPPGGSDRSRGYDPWRHRSTGAARFALCSGAPSEGERDGCPSCPESQEERRATSLSLKEPERKGLAQADGEE